MPVLVKRVYLHAGMGFCVGWKVYFSTLDLCVGVVCVCVCRCAKGCARGGVAPTDGAGVCVCVGGGMVLPLGCAQVCVGGEGVFALLDALCVCLCVLKGVLAASDCAHSGGVWVYAGLGGGSSGWEHPGVVVGVCVCVHVCVHARALGVSQEAESACVCLRVLRGYRVWGLSGCAQGWGVCGWWWGWGVGAAGGSRGRAGVVTSTGCPSVHRGPLGVPLQGN